MIDRRRLIAGAIALLATMSLRAAPWAQALADPVGSPCHASAAARDGSGGWLVGGQSGGAGFLASVDDSGAISWCTHLGDAAWTVRGISVASDGSVLVAGEGRVIPSGTAAWAARVRPDGTVAWVERLPAMAKASRLLELSDGSLRLMGSHAPSGNGVLVALDAGGGVTWARSMSVSSCCIAGFEAAEILAGDRIAWAGVGAGFSSLSPFVGVLEPDGTSAWAGSVSWDWPWYPADLAIGGMDVAPDGTIGVTGSGGSEDLGTGAWDPFLLRMQPDGSGLDVRSFQSDDWVSSGGVSGGADGGWVLGGWTFVYPGEPADLAVAWKVDAAGNMAWQGSFARASHDQISAVAAASDGGALLAGDHVPLARGAVTEGFLARVDATGDPGSTCLERGATGFIPVAPALTPLAVSVTAAPLTVIASPRVSAAGCAIVARGFGDAFEPDDLPDIDDPPLPDPVSDGHDFCDDADDWQVVWACAGESVVLSLENLGARSTTTMDLVMPDGSTVVASGDATTPIAWTFPTGGAWYLHVHDLFASDDSAWRVVVERRDPSCGTWVARYGEPRGWAHSIRPTRSGTFLVSGTSAFDPTTGSDQVLMEVDDSGAPLWKATVGAASWDSARAIEATSDGGILATSTNQLTGQICRVAPDRMSLDWDATFRRNYGSVWEDIRALPDGGAYVAGSCTNGSIEALSVVRLDPAGAISWEQAFWRGRWISIGNGIVVTPDGGCVVAGEIATATGSATVGVMISLAADGTVRWQKEYPEVPWFFRIAATLDGGFACATNNGVVKLDANGDVTWGRALLGTPDLALLDIAVLASGRIAVGARGETGSTYIFTVLALETDGSVAWQHELSTPGLNGSAWSIAPLPDGGMLVAGIVDDDIGIVRIDRDGNVLGPCARWLDTSYASVAVGVTALPVALSTSSTGMTTADAGFVLTDAVPTRMVLCSGGARPPGEVSPPGSPQPLIFTSHVDLQWEDGVSSRSTSFDLHRGGLADLRLGRFGDCVQRDLPSPAAVDASPVPGGGWFYLVRGRNSPGLGPLGSTSLGVARTPSSSCP